MTRPRAQVTATIAGAGLLLLCGCGSSAAPGPAGPAAAAGRPTRLADRFCAGASTFMRGIPAGPKTKHLTPAQARAQVSVILVSTVQGYTSLENEAPAQLRVPLQKIIRVYQADEELLSQTGDMARVSQSMVQNEGAGSAAFQQVLTYLSARCR